MYWILAFAGMTQKKRNDKEKLTEKTKREVITNFEIRDPFKRIERHK